MKKRDPKTQALIIAAIAAGKVQKVPTYDLRKNKPTKVKETV